MHDAHLAGWRRWRAPAVLALAVAALARSADAGPGELTRHAHGGGRAGEAPPPFVATTEKPFGELMDHAMAVMDHGMSSAPATGEPDHDFVTMMIPHHQGAIDMAKALLLHTRDPELRNLAQGIIAEQQLEIDLMKAWLARHAARARGAEKSR